MPENLDTITQLGLHYVKNDQYDKACHFFQRAANIQKKEVKWGLMVASCYRRMGALNQALNLYKDINSKHPDNIECLKFLVQISKEMGLGYEMYA